MTEQFDADVEATEADLPVACKFKGKAFVGQRTPVVDVQQMDEVGFVQKFDFDLTVRLSQFVAPDREPAVHDDIELQDDATEIWTWYHIDRAIPSQDGVTVQFGMTQKT